jgi:hypothetical protein
MPTKLRLSIVDLVAAGVAVGVLAAAVYVPRSDVAVDPAPDRAPQALAPANSPSVPWAPSMPTDRHARESEDSVANAVKPTSPGRRGVASRADAVRARDASSALTDGLVFFMMALGNYHANRGR